MTQTLWSMHTCAHLQRFNPGGLPGAGETTSFTLITRVRHTHTHTFIQSFSSIFQDLSHYSIFLRKCTYFKRLFHTRLSSLKGKLEQKFSWELKLCWLRMDKDYCTWGAGEDSLHNESKKPQITLSSSCYAPHSHKTLRSSTSTPTIVSYTCTTRSAMNNFHMPLFCINDLHSVAVLSARAGTSVMFSRVGEM